VKRAERKKLKKKFQVGDIVTWGREAIAHRVLEVRDDGLVVDATAHGFGHLFVAYDGNNRDRAGRGPLKKIDKNYKGRVQ
jgi:hypothetical protein